MIFLHPWWLLPAAVLLTLYVILKHQRADNWAQVIARPVYEFLSSGNHTTAFKPPGLLIAALACIALSGPAFQAEDQQSYRHSQGFIIIADVSRSMTLEDISPSRLAAVRNTALDLAHRAMANSTALIVYAGDAFLVVPPSFDQSNFQNNVTLLEHGIVPLEGSNLTRALSLAWSVIEDSGLINARLFVLSDTGGFNNKSDAAIARLASYGHRTDIIVYGSNNTDNATPFDLQTAKALAKSGNGKLLRADAIGRIDLGQLNLSSERISQQLLTSAGLTSIRWRNQSHWILLLAVPLMLWLFVREKN